MGKAHRMHRSALGANFWRSFISGPYVIMPAACAVRHAPRKRCTGPPVGGPLVLRPGWWVEKPCFWTWGPKPLSRFQTFELVTDFRSPKNGLGGKTQIRKNTQNLKSYTILPAPAPRPSRVFSTPRDPSPPPPSTAVPPPEPIWVSLYESFSPN
jgi:hypothetical protein